MSADPAKEDEETARAAAAAEAKAALAVRAAVEEATSREDACEAREHSAALMLAFEESVVALASERAPLHSWLQERVRALAIDFDVEVLFAALSEIEEESLGDDEALKMWLGFGDGDPLPEKLKVVIFEFRQRRLLLRFAGQ